MDIVRAVPKRAAIYLRQSLDASGEGRAVARQRKDCLRLCEDRGWTVVAEYNDNDRSASGKRVRPGFQKMLADARRGEFDAVVAWHTDRLTRSLKDYMPLSELAEHGVAVVTVSGDLDLSNEMGATVGGLLAVIANAEIKRKGARQSRGNQQSADEGRPSQGGATPYGFRDEMVNGRRVRTLDEEAAAVIRKTYEAFLAGRSLSMLAKDLNVAGAQTVRRSPWTRSRVGELLANPRNAGLRAYKKEIVGKAAWEPIVDEGTYRAALAILRDPARVENRTGGTRRWLGSGLFLCGLCGHTLLSNYKQYPAYGAITTLRIYLCPNKCLQRKAEAIDDYVTAEVIGRLSRGDVRKFLADAQRPDTGKLLAEADRLRVRMDALAVELATDDSMTPAQFRKLNQTLAARLAAVEGQLASSSRASALTDFIGATDVQARWDAADLDRRRAIISAMCTVHVHKGPVGGNSRHGARPLPPGSVKLTFRA